MRKLKFAFLAALMLLVAGQVKAATGTVSPYKVDFNNVNPNQTGWVVDTSWGHIVDETNGTTVYSTGEFAFVKYLTIGAQNSNKDVLVTPQVTGEVKLNVRKTGPSVTSSLKVYKVTKSGDTYVLGDEIKLFPNTELSDWQTKTLTLTDNADGYIGIWGENVAINNFEATSATVELVPALTVTSFTNNKKYTDVGADGNFTAEFKVKVKNTGNVDLTTSSENYTVTLKKGGVVITSNSTAIPSDLVIGAESAEFTVSATLPYSGNEDAAEYQVMENVSGTTYGSTVTIKPTAYVPVLKLVKGSSSTDLTNSDTQDFGLAATNATMTYTLSNEGAKQLSISAMAFSSSDFTSNVTGAQTLAAHETKTVTVTLAATSGTPSATLNITSDGGNLTIPFKATVLDPTKYFEGFESGSFPEDFDTSLNKDSDDDAVWSVINMPTYGMSGNNSTKIARANSYGLETSRIITPLLESDGTILTFDAAKTPSYDGYLLVVAYSADKTTWTPVKTIDNNGLDTEFKKVDVIVPAGNYYVAFSGKKVNIDNIYGYKLATAEVRNWTISDVVVPAETKVGKETTVTAKLKNEGNVDEAADSYTATLYVNNTSVATAIASALAKNTTNDYTFTFTPTTDGDFKAYVEFKKGDYSVKSDEADISILDASAALEETVKVGEGTDNNGSTLVWNTYTYNEHVSLYPKNMLTGIAANAAITKIGYKIANDGTKTLHMTIYMENTNDATQDKPASETPNVSSMTKVFDGDVAVPEGGDEDSYKYIDWTINLTSQFVYAGEGLRIVILEKRVEGTGAIYANLDNDDTRKYTYLRYSNNENMISWGTTQASFSQKYLPILVLTTKAVETVDVTVGTTGWATFCSSAPLDLTGTDYAYQVTAVDGENVTVEPVTKAVAANTPLLIKGEGTHNIPVAASGDDLTSTNLLKPGTGAAVEAGTGTTRYVLVPSGATAVFQKIDTNSAKVSMNKAYLEVTGSAPARLSILDGNVTGISATLNDQSEMANEKVIFDLQGRRVAQPVKGLYIVNGKKVVMK